MFSLTISITGDDFAAPAEKQRNRETEGERSLNMNISIDQLIQPQQSYSRTGKMAEAMNQAKIRIGGRSNKKSVDYSKLLAANELGSEENTSATMCSSPRLHPTVLMKEEYVDRQEKEAAFRQSMSNVLLSDATQSSATANNKSSDFDWVAARHALDESSKKKRSFPTSSFLAKPRVFSTQQSNPPVGHYRPRYDIVEEAAPRVKIARKTHSPHRTHTPPHSSAHAVTDVNAAIIPSSESRPDSTCSPASLAGSMSPHKRVGESTAVIASAQPAKPVHPTWPFASGSPGHILPLNRSWSVEPDPNRRMNMSAIEVPRLGTSKVYCQLRKRPGRDGGEAARIKDIFYNVKVNPFTSVAVPNLRLSTGRDAPPALPRTSADVPRVFSPTRADEEDVRFKRQPVLVDFQKSLTKQPSRKVAHTSVSDSVVECPSPSETGSPTRVRSPDFSKYTPRRNRTDALQLQYDASYAAVDPHERATKIHERCGFAREVPNPRKDEPSELHPSDVTLHPKVCRDIHFDGFVSRDARARVGRGAEQPRVCEAQQKFYDVSPSRSHHVPGNPHIAQHVSRQHRAEVMSPPPVFSDHMYNVNSEAVLPSLRKGMVQIDKMVDREQRSHSSLR